MIDRSTLTLTALLTMLMAAPSFAQAPPANPPTPAPAQPAPADPKACAPGQRLELEDGKPKDPSTSGRTLSETLARNDGVLCPPQIDPEIRAPTPQGGTIKVVPPPGTPGGDPSLLPK
jgi:hypothetical protein